MHRLWIRINNREMANWGKINSLRFVFYWKGQNVSTIPCYTQQFNLKTLISFNVSFALLRQFNDQWIKDSFATKWQCFCAHFLSFFSIEVTSIVPKVGQTVFIKKKQTVCKAEKSVTTSVGSCETQNKKDTKTLISPMKQCQNVFVRLWCRKWLRCHQVASVDYIDCYLTHTQIFSAQKCFHSFLGRMRINRKMSKHSLLWLFRLIAIEISKINNIAESIPFGSLRDSFQLCCFI